jgi:hypothetical protein
MQIRPCQWKSAAEDQTASSGDQNRDVNLPEELRSRPEVTICSGCLVYSCP